MAVGRYARFEVGNYAGSMTTTPDAPTTAATMLTVFFARCWRVAIRPTTGTSCLRRLSATDYDYGVCGFSGRV
jgi:hypothetical protein